MKNEPQFTEEPEMAFRVAMGDIIRGDTPAEEAPNILAWAREEIKKFTPAEQKRLAVHLESATRSAINNYSKACHDGWDAVVYLGGKRGR